MRSLFVSFGAGLGGGNLISLNDLDKSSQLSAVLDNAPLYLTKRWEPTAGGLVVRLDAGSHRNRPILLTVLRSVVRHGATPALAEIPRFRLSRQADNRSIVRHYTRSRSLRIKLVAHLRDLCGLCFEGGGQSRNVFLLLRHHGL